MTASINVNAACEQKASKIRRPKEKRQYNLIAGKIEGNARVPSWTKKICYCRTEVKGKVLAHIKQTSYNRLEHCPQTLHIHLTKYI